MSSEKQEEFRVQSSPATKIDYKRILNQQQFEAVTTVGPVLVIAGAGTGKTATLVHRVAYLIENGIDPRKILMLTFTKKAATEMMDRVSTLLKNKAGENIAGGTFHSFANSILRQYANLIEIPVNFSILDNADAEDLIDKIRSELGFCNSKSVFPAKRRLFEIISSARNRQLTIENVIKAEFSGLTKIIPEIEKIHQRYAELKTEIGVFDFDDLMEILVNKLNTNPLFRKIVSGRFKYMMVDEYQDTNILQNEIVKLIASNENNVMSVGDDMQSIYAFRGANFENIINFPTAFPNCKIIKLEQNYRSQPTLLDFTNEIIEKAPANFMKKLWSDKTSGNKPVFGEFFTALEEAEYVVDEILKLRENNIPLDQIAVLTRAGWNSNHVQLELEKRAIPYVVVGGLKFTERKHVKDVLCYLRIVHNPKDILAWHRVLKLIPGVGSKTADSIISGTFTIKKNNKIEELKKLIIEISADEVQLPNKITAIKNHYFPLLEAVDSEAEIRKQDIEMIQERSAGYDSLEKFLSDFALNPPCKRLAKQINPLVDETEEKQITISTIHSAKGLEWHTVFLIHALDGIIPSIKATTDDEIDEERRLFYVACTRAKEKLIITRPAYLSIYDAFLHFPSRFLLEINDDKYLNINKIDYEYFRN